MSTERRTLQPDVRSLGRLTQTGTRVKGVNIAGTVSFATRFAGTPSVVTDVMGGSSNFGRVVPFKVPSRFSGSFTWRASGSGGTFQWWAEGPVR